MRAENLADSQNKTTYNIYHLTDLEAQAGLGVQTA